MDGETGCAADVMGDLVPLPRLHAAKVVTADLVTPSRRLVPRPRAESPRVLGHLRRSEVTDRIADSGAVRQCSARRRETERIGRSGVALTLPHPMPLRRSPRMEEFVRCRFGACRSVLFRSHNAAGHAWNPDLAVLLVRAHVRDDDCPNPLPGRLVDLLERHNCGRDVLADHFPVLRG